MSDPAMLHRGAEAGACGDGPDREAEGAGRSRRSTASASAAGSSWRSPATTGSRSMTTRRGSASPRSISASSPASAAPAARSGRPGRSTAMQAMLTGRMIKASAARGMGLVDKLVRHRDMLHWEARKAVLQKRQLDAGAAERSASWPGARSARRSSRRCAPRRARRRAMEHYPAPHALIDLFEAAWRRLARDGRRRERQASCR